MKKFTLLLFILIHQQAISCSCMAVNIIENLAESDFVAIAKIVNSSQSKKNKHYNKIDVETLKLYKGEKTTSLFVNNAQGSMCGLETPIDSTWLIYANKNQDGDLRFDLCSHSEQVDGAVNFGISSPKELEIYKKSLETKLQLLDYLKSKNIGFTNKYGLKTAFSKGCLKDFDGIQTKNHFALYELIVDDQLNVNLTKPLIEFSNSQLQENLLQCVSKSVKIYKSDKQTTLPSFTKVLVPLFFHPAGPYNESSIDQWD